MSLKRFVNDKEQWDAFTLYLDNLISNQHRSMESLHTSEELYRAQGAIQAYKNVKYMRDVINGSKG